MRVAGVTVTEGWDFSPFYLFAGLFDFIPSIYRTVPFYTDVTVTYSWDYSNNTETKKVAVTPATRMTLAGNGTESLTILYIAFAAHFCILRVEITPLFRLFFQ